jgi:hypothetical protein
MPTECTPKLFEFEAVERRAVVAQFDGGTITSNAGALLLGHRLPTSGWLSALMEAGSKPNAGSAIGLATAKQSTSGRSMRYACGIRSPEFERF